MMLDCFHYVLIQVTNYVRDLQHFMCEQIDLHVFKAVNNHVCTLLLTST